MKEAMTDVVDPLFVPPPNVSYWDQSLDLIRLLVFLLMIVRFYLGSAVFFEEAHCGEESHKKYASKSYLGDFLMGLVHFIIFSAWATQVKPPHPSQYLFLQIGYLVLIFDVAWFLVCRKYDTRHLMKLWMIFNTATALISLLLFFALEHYHRTPFTIEVIALIPFIAASVIDIIELLTGRPIVKQWLASVLGQPNPA